MADRLDGLAGLAAAAGTAHAHVLSEPDRRRTIALRQAVLPLLLATPGRAKPLAFVEDAAVPAARLARVRGPLRGDRPPPRHLGLLLRTRLGRHAARAPGDRHRPTSTACATCARSPRRWRTSSSTAAARSRASTATGSHARPSWPRCTGPELVGAFAECKRLWDPDGLAQPGRDRRPRADGPLAAPRPRPTSAERAHRARLLGRGRIRGRGGPLQRGRPVPHHHHRHDVPVLHGHRGRAGDHAGACQRAALDPRRHPPRVGAVRAPPARRPRPLPRVQGLSHRVPHRGRHGGAEERGAGPAGRPPRLRRP